MNEKKIAECLDLITERILELNRNIEFLMKQHMESVKLINKLADAFLAQQIRIELLNKEMLNFIPDKDRRENQIIQ